MNKIIIVDDHSLFREGIKLLIENEGIGEVIGEAENGKVFLDLLQSSDPDLIIMDIEMPVMDGYEATKRALKIRPNLKILVLTMLNEKSNYFDMVNAGASGFVLKTSGKQEFEKAIKIVMLGETYFSNELIRQIISNDKSDITVAGSKVLQIVKSLSPREIEILQYFCNGLTVNEIADKLFLSPKTIEAHRSAILKKTNTRNTINLVLFAIKNKIVIL